MKKKASEPDYSDQFNCIPTDSCETDELRAWMLYEYARESKTLLSLVEDHKKGIVCPDLGDALGIIKDLSVPFYEIVKAMGRRPSFSKSWVELNPLLRKKMIAGCRIPAVSIAPESVIRDCLGDDPALGWGQDITCKLPFGTDEPLRLIPLLLNAELTKSHLLKEINDFFDRELNITQGIGRSPRNIEFLINGLQSLSILRILSTRTISEAKATAQLSARALFSEAECERRWRGQISSAQDIFQQLFPSLFAGPDNHLGDEMISYRIYKQNHKAGGIRKKNLSRCGK